MITKKLFTIITLGIALITSQVYSQTKKTLVGVVGFTSSEPDHSSRAKELQEVIAEAFGANPSVEMLNRAKSAEIDKELTRQKGANYIKGKTVAQNKAHGAELLVTGNLSNILVEEKKIGGPTGLKTTKGMLTFSLEAIDVATGVTKNSRTFDLSGMDAGSMDIGGQYGTSSDVVAGLILKNKDQVKLKVRGWVNELFPPRLKILSIDKKDKSGLPEEVTIVGGKEAKLEVNMLININENEAIEYEGKTLNRAKPVGLLKVLSLQDDIVVCEVEEGKEIIEKSMTAPNYQLMVDYEKKAKNKPPNPFKKNKS